MKRLPMLLLMVSALAALLFLSACSSLAGDVSAHPAAEATPTECGCSAEGPRAKTPGALPPSAATVPAGPDAAEETAAVDGPAAAERTPAAEDLQALRGKWQAYQAALPGSPAREVSFDFPAAYTGSAFGFCAPRAAALPEDSAQAVLLRVAIGSRTSLTIQPAPADLTAAADALRAEPARSEDTFEAAQETSAAGVPALKLPYRSGGAGRYSEVTLFIKDGLLYRVESGGPSACDIPALDLPELAASQRLLESLRVE
jgi:hypothetical protein